MRTPICDELGIEFPIFAFTHCRDVVAAVCKAGGFGVLGAVGFTPEQLEVELDWIDEHVGDHPYGVDIVIPGKYEGMGDMDPDHLGRRAAQAWSRRATSTSPRSSWPTTACPSCPRSEGNSHAAPRLDRGHRHARRSRWRWRHPKVKLIANALGTPPADVIDHIHDAGLKVAALCGSPYQALKHKEAGVDIVIAQGGEGGGHTGEVGSVVLWPQVAKAIAPTPVLAAGGIGSRRADRRRAGHRRPGRVGRLAVADRRGGRPPPGPEAAAARRHVPRHRAQPLASPASRAACSATTGPRPGSAATPPTRCRMPLQYMVSGDCVARSHRYADKALDGACSTRSARSSASSTRSRRPAPSSSAWSRSTSTPSTASPSSPKPPTPESELALTAPRIPGATGASP